MATKELTIDEQRAALIEAITKAEKVLAEAKAAYQVFAKENPHVGEKQASLEQIRKIKAKMDKATLADHQKSNAAAAGKVAQEKLIAKVKAGE